MDVKKAKCLQEESKGKPIEKIRGSKVPAKVAITDKFISEKEGKSMMKEME